jgi:hypothetical protein
MAASVAKSQWMEKSGTIYEGNARLDLAMSLPSASRPTTRNTAVFYIPLERVVDGVTVVEDTIIFNVSQVIARTVTDAEALKAYTMFKNLMAHATVQSYLAGREPVY